MYFGGCSRSCARFAERHRVYLKRSPGDFSVSPAAQSAAGFSRNDNLITGEISPRATLGRNDRVYREDFYSKKTTRVRGFFALLNCSTVGRQLSFCVYKLVPPWPTANCIIAIPIFVGRRLSYSRPYPYRRSVVGRKNLAVVCRRGKGRPVRRSAAPRRHYSPSAVTAVSSAGCSAAAAGAAL